MALNLLSYRGRIVTRHKKREILTVLVLRLLFLLRELLNADIPDHSDMSGVDIMLTCSYIYTSFFFSKISVPDDIPVVNKRK